MMDHVRYEALMKEVREDQLKREQMRANFGLVWMIIFVVGTCTALYQVMEVIDVIVR